MTHITHQSQRDENAAIHNCPHRNVPVWVIVDDGWGEPYEDLKYENQCGPSTTLSIAQDRCNRCGKTFTY